jgi:hypothetical protein
LPLAMAGSMIVHSRLLQGALLQCLAQRGVAVQATSVDEPALGALRIAQRMAHGESAQRSEWQL